MLQRKLLIKPCFNFLISDLVALKQGFNLRKSNNMKIKQYKRAPRRDMQYLFVSFGKNESCFHIIVTIFSAIEEIYYLCNCNFLNIGMDITATQTKHTEHKKRSKLSHYLIMTLELHKKSL